MAAKEQILQDVHNYGVNVQTREIYLHSHYSEDVDGSEPGVEYRQATTFIKNLQFLDFSPIKPILIHLHSQGGSWDDGMAMFNAIQFSQSYVTMLCYAQASSMSGVILQASSLRVMMPDCHFMMHHGSTGSGVSHPYALKNEAEFQIRACKRMLQIFAQRAIVGEFFKKRKTTTVESVYLFFDKKLKKEVDWYLDSDEAVFYGLSDCVLGCDEYPDIQSLRG